MLYNNKRLAVRLRLKKSDSKSSNILFKENRGQVCQSLRKQNTTLNLNVNEICKINQNPLETECIEKYMELSTNRQMNNLGENKIFCEILKKVRSILKSLLAEAIIISQIPNQNIPQQFTSEQQNKVAISEEFPKQGEPLANRTNEKIDQLKKDQKHGKGKSASGSSGRASQQQASYEKLLKQNEELKHETSQMQHYIISLKELLNERQKHIEKLISQNKKKQEEMNEIRKVLQKMENECKILKQEVAGYEQKFEQLEMRTPTSMKQEKLSQSFNKEDVSSSINDDSQKMSIEHSLSIDEDSKVNLKQAQSKQVSNPNKCKPIDVQKLEIIYEKTEKLLKKCKDLQQQKVEKDKEIHALRTVIKQIVEGVGLQKCEEDRIDEELGKQIAEQIKKKLKEQQGQGQKIQQSKLEMIGRSLEEMQQLLNKNNEDLTDENIGFYEFVKIAYSEEGIDVNKINEYLNQLESTIKTIYNHKQKDLFENYIIKKQKLQTYLNDFLTNFQYLLEHTENIIHKSLLEAEGSVKNLEEEILNLASKVKDIKTMLNQKLANQSSLNEFQSNVQKVLSSQVIKMKDKYYPSNPQFVEEIIKKLMQLRAIQSQQELSEVFDSIFEAIKAKDEEIKQQIGRRKEVIKQRSAAIAQIVKKGMKESSIHDSKGMKQSYTFENK